MDLLTNETKNETKEVATVVQQDSIDNNLIKLVENTNRLNQMFFLFIVIFGVYIIWHLVYSAFKDYFS